MTTQHLNPRPSFLAALLVEQGAYTAEQIGIHPVEGVLGAALREVQEVKHDRKTGNVNISARSKSEQRLALEQGLPAQDPMRGWAQVFEREMTLFRIAVIQHERTHLLGLSPLQAVFFEETRLWEADQQKILAFFLPYRSQIRGDKVLTAKCLQAALGQEVRLADSTPLKQNIAGAKAGNCVLNAESAVGGIIVSQKPCVHITIGPVDMALLPQFAPGGRQRRFLEEVLLPQLLPEEWEWTLEITVKPEYRTLKVAEAGRPAYVGINSRIA